MAYNNNPWQQQNKDTGWGLIFRLNLLMGKIERDTETGNLSSWNLHLDRIYANITFKNPHEIIYDEKGKVLDIRFPKEDVAVFSRFAKMIDELKKKEAEVLQYDDEYERRRKITELRTRYYNLLFKKDIWIRKVMFKMKLYLRESESNPAKAIYGG